MGEKQILVGYTPRLDPQRKISFKFTTKRPREEELVQIKGEIVAKQSQKRVCMREVEQTKDSYPKQIKPHKEGK